MNKIVTHLASSSMDKNHLNISSLAFDSDLGRKVYRILTEYYVNI